MAKVTVHVWERALMKQQSPGHATVEIGSVYVSYFPGECAQSLSLSRTLQQDITLYRERKQTHNVVELQGLDTVKMMTRLHELQKEKSCWSAFRYQCARMVLELLRAGGADGYASEDAKQGVVWSAGSAGGAWPEDVLWYARSVQVGLEGKAKGSGSKK
jgi:hypothetical protein